MVYKYIRTIIASGLRLLLVLFDILNENQWTGWNFFSKRKKLAYTSIRNMKFRSDPPNWSIKLYSTLLTFMDSPKLVVVNQFVRFWQFNLFSRAFFPLLHLHACIYNKRIRQLTQCLWIPLKPQRIEHRDHQKKIQSRFLTFSILSLSLYRVKVQYLKHSAAINNQIFSARFPFKIY